MKSTPAREAGALAAFLLLALVVTWPVVGCLSTHLLCARFDAWGSLWLASWMEGLLGGGEPLALYSSHLGYPFGVDLAFIDAWWFVLLSAPLRALLGPVVGFNLHAIAAITLGAYGAYRLGRGLLGSTRPALLCGALFGFNAGTGNFMLEGLAPLLWTIWLPLTLLAALELGKPRGGALPVARLALFLGLACYTSGYHGAMAVGLALLALLALAFAARPGRATLLGRAAAALLVAALLVSPLALAMARGLDRSHGPLDAFKEQEVTDHRGQDAALRQAQLAKTARDGSASPAASLRLRSADPEQAFRSTYLGYTALALALLGLWSRRRRLVIFCLSAGGLFLLLSWGPYLNLGDGARLPLPYEWLHRAVPHFGLFKFPHRFALASHLCLALAAACGLRHLERRLRGRADMGARLLVPMLLCLATAEAALVASKPADLTPVDGRVPAVYSRLARAAGEFAVLELTGQENHFRERVMYYQSVSRRPIFFSGLFRRNLDLQGLVADMVAGRARACPGPEPCDQGRAAMLEALRALNVRYILLHGYSFTAQDSQDPTALAAALDRDLGPPTVHRNVPLSYNGQVHDGPIQMYAVPGWTSAPLARDPTLRQRAGLMRALADSSRPAAERLLMLARAAGGRP